MTYPTAPVDMTEIYMPDDACMVQVYRLDESGLVTQAWAVVQPFSDVCDQVSELFGQPLGGSSGTAGVAERLYSMVKEEQAAGNAQAVEYG